MMKIPKRSLFIFTLMAILLLCFSATAGDAVTVTNNSDSGAGSLRQAIADVDTGGTISFDNALSGDVITLSSEITINKSLTIQGLGADKLSVSGNNSNRIFYIENNSNVNISDLSIVDGNRMGTRARNGGGISLYNNCNLSLLNVNFKNCTAQLGGAIVCSNGTSINIQGCEFINNFTQDYSSDVTDPKGGAVYIGSNPTSTSTLSVKDSIFSENKSLNGGAIYTTNYVGTTIDNCTFTNNQSTATGGPNPGGGAIYASGSGGSSILEIYNSSFFSNKNKQNDLRNGGAIYVSNLASLVIDNCFFSKNGLDQSAYNGGAVYIDKSPALVNSSIFSENSARLKGGALYINESPVEIINTTVNGNISTDGGGLYNVAYSNTLSMLNCTLAGNNAEIFNAGGNQGGGIYHEGFEGIFLSNCTLSGNFATNNGSGIFTTGKDVLEIKNCIVAANTGTNSQIADSTGGTTNYIESFSITSDDIVSSDIFAGGLEENDGPFVGSTVSADTVPLLTLALKEGSPAIDTASSTDIFGNVVSTDQRGATRPSPEGGSFDIGAFELQQEPIETFTITTTHTEGGSITTDSDAENSASNYFIPAGESITFEITSDNGYYISQINVDEEPYYTHLSFQKVITEDTYTFDNVSEDHTLSATFAAEDDPVDPVDPDEPNLEGGSCNVGAFTPLAGLLVLPMLLMFKK